MARLNPGRSSPGPGAGFVLFALLLPLIMPLRAPAAGDKVVNDLVGRRAALAGDWAMDCAGPSSAPVAPPFSIAWTYDADDDLAGPPVPCGNKVMVITKSAGIRALGPGGRTAWKRAGTKAGNEWPGIDGGTGALKWVAKLGGRLAGTPVPGPDSVLIAAESGEVILVDTRTGRPRWRRKLDLPVTLPAYDGSLVLLGSGQDAVALDAASGREVFRTGLDCVPVFSPAIAADGCYFAHEYGMVALDRSGSVRWRVKSLLQVAVAPVTTDSGVVLCTRGGGIRSLSREDGKSSWDRLIDGDPTAVSPAGTAVSIATREGRITVLAESNGARLWSVLTGVMPIDWIAMGEGRLCFASGRRVTAILPAPEPPESIDRRLVTGGTRLEWAPVEPNGGPVTEYRVWRQDNGSWSVAGECDPSTTTFVAPGGWDTQGYAVSAVGPGGSEGPLSRPVLLDYSGRLVRLLTVAPRPFDPGSGPLAIEFDLNETAMIGWDIVDAEGRAMTEEKKQPLTPGAARLEWDGRDRTGHGAEPGIYLVRLRAIRDKQEESYVRGFAVVDSSGTSWCPAVIPSLFSVGNRTE